MEGLLQARPNDAESLLAVYRYREEYNLPKASDALEAAFKAEPRNPAVLAAQVYAEKTAAQAAYSKSGRLEDAKPHLELALEFCKRAIAAKPEAEEAYLNAADIQQRLGNPKEALETCQAGLEKNANSILLNLLTAKILLDQARPLEAARTDRSQGKDGPFRTGGTFVSNNLRSRQAK